MPEKISWTSSVQVLGGPKITAAGTVEVTAYDKLQVVIPGAVKANLAEPAGHEDNAGLPATTVEVQPANSNDRLRVLSITADRYSEDLIYTVAGGGAENVALDAAHLIVGAGALGLLGAAPQTLEFRNGLGLDNNATVTILVGREATGP